MPPAVLNHEALDASMPYRQDHKASYPEALTNGNSKLGVSTAPNHYNDWPNEQGFQTEGEQRTPIELKVTGNIPAYAAGTLYRTGPGKYKVSGKDGKTIATSHWFDGYTQVHRFHIQPPTESSPTTRVFYNSRLSVDSHIDHVRQTGNFGNFTFAQKRDPCQSYFKKLLATFAPFTRPDTKTMRPDGQNVGVTLSVNMPGIPAPPVPLPPSDSPGPGPSGGAQEIKTLLNKTDANIYQYLDPTTLEPLGVTDQKALHPLLTGPLSAAHAKTDPLTGDVYNYNLDVARVATYRVFRANASGGGTDIIATITDAPGAYLHSFFLTARHVILCVWGSHYAYRGLALLYHRNILDAIAATDRAKPCLWYVIDRTPANRGVVATYTSDAFYAFHTVNAFEAPSPTVPGAVDILADLVRYDDTSVLTRFYYENMLSSSPSSLNHMGEKGASTRPRMTRFRLPGIPPATSTTPAPSSPRKAHTEFCAPAAQSLELPTLNPAFIAKRHRYIYGVTDTGSSTFFDGLAKFDTETRECVFWSERGQSAGEAIFVADTSAGERRAGGEERDDGEGREGGDGERDGSEDRGVLLSIVLDGFSGTSYLLVLDVKSMKEVGRADLERAVGFGFHGSFVGDGMGERVLDC